MSKMKIMVVDDNTVNLATLEQELSDKYVVIPMLTGRRAIKYLYRETCDMILLDVQMPIMDGIETLREIRTQENGVDVPVIFLTAKRDAQTVLEGSKLGIVDFITKPFDADNLKERIDTVFKKLGVLPLENDELFDRVNEIYHALLDLDEEKANKCINEILQFKMEDDVLGRLQNVKTKLDAGNSEGALEMIEHIKDMLDRMLDEIDRGTLAPISIAEIITRLHSVSDDLESFRTKEAQEKIVGLKGCDVPENVRKDLKAASDYLKAYDDIEAKKVVTKMLEELSNQETPSAGGGQGYHSSRLM